MLEVKMGMDGFTGNNSDSSSGRAEAQENEGDEGKVKQEAEPVAGTSKEGTFNNTIAKNSENEFQSSGKSAFSNSLFQMNSDKETRVYFKKLRTVLDKNSLNSLPGIN